MTEIEGYVKEIITERDNKYCRIINSLSKDEYLIPHSQFELMGGVRYNYPYTFLKTYDNKLKKSYLSIINPDYKIGEFYDFQIVDSMEIDDKKYFQLSSSYLSPLSVLAFDWQKDYNYVKCRVIGYKRGIPILRNVDMRNSDWNINQIYNFKVVNFGLLKDKSGNEFNTVTVEIDNNYIIVKCNSWHTRELWKFKDINCRVIGIKSDGNPRLIADDNRHPLYRLDNQYDFKVLNFRDKILPNKVKIKIIEVTDSSNIVFEVKAFKNQENKLICGDLVSCKVEKIGTRISLRQVAQDPFYFNFEDIIQSKEIKKDFFEPFLNDDNKFNSKLSSQYFSKSAFWVLTYCKFIIPQIKKNLIYRKEFKKLQQVIEIHSTIETWIISKGILRAILDDSERKSAKINIEKIIENTKIEAYVLNKIINLEFSSFFTDSINFKEIYYLFKLAGIHIIDERNVITLLESTKKGSIDSNELNFLKHILIVIRSQFLSFKVSNDKNYFILANHLNMEEQNEIKRFFNWSYVKILIYDLINDNNSRNLLIAKLYRYSSRFERNIDLKKKLLFNSFYTLLNRSDYMLFPVKKDIHGNTNIDLERVEENPNLNHYVEFDKSFYNIRLTQRYQEGYRIMIKNVNGYLLNQHINDPALKHYVYNEVNWDLNVEIILHSNEFNFFIARQLPLESDNYFSKNLYKVNTPKKNTVIFATVKESYDYGVFFYTEFGDGLLRLHNISYEYIDRELIPYYFKPGTRMPIYLLGITDNKIELSFKRLIGTDYEEFYNETFNLEEIEYTEHQDANLDYHYEIERGFVFEDVAMIQVDLEEKIKYLRLGKSFYSNAKSSRSYLINIYIEYFYSLLKLDNIIKNYSFNNYEEFKKGIVLIKDKVEPKTLENYPESRNLLFFIDILTLFNSKDEIDLDVLFNLIKKPLEENDSLLKVVCKTVLANNLIISESESYSDEEIDSYTLKNLKKIRRYITHGVLSLEDVIEDKLYIELEETRLYWKNRIAQDEGEKLEFKSTLITPVPNEQKLKIIETLEAQLLIQTSESSISSLKTKIDEIRGLNAQKRIIHSALKTIVAFANTTGGTLLLGVSDDKKIFGLEQDYNSFKKGKDRDEFGKYFDSIIKDYIGNSFSSNFLEKQFLNFPGGDILIVSVRPSAEEIFLLRDENGKKCEDIYIRNLSSSERLDGIELAKFIKKKYREQHIMNISVDESAEL